MLLLTLLKAQHLAGKSPGLLILEMFWADRGHSGEVMSWEHLSDKEEI